MIHITSIDTVKTLPLFDKMESICVTYTFFANKVCFANYSASRTMCGWTLMSTRPDGDNDRANILRMTANVVSAYVGNNTVQPASIPDVINSVYSAFSGLNGVDNAVADTGRLLRPAVPIKKSITPDYIVCLEDGKKLKMLKRHLRTTYSLTPDQYRSKWGLKPDYPMVAPNYSAQRSNFAKRIGLGKTESRGPSIIR